MKGLIKLKTNVNEIKDLNVIEAYRLWREAQDLMNVLATGRVYNIDCLIGLRRMKDGSVDGAIISDPPYLQKMTDKPAGAATDTAYVSELNFISHGFDIQILDECIRIMGRDRFKGIFYCNKEQIPMYIEYFTEKGMEFRLLTWSKSNCCPKFCSNTYVVNSMEYIVLAYAKEVEDEIHLETDHFTTPVVKVSKNDELYHPTTKFVPQLQALIEAITDEGQIICDPFAGSGTTFEAAIRSNRKFIGFELLKKYYVVSNKRIELALLECPDYNLTSTILEDTVDTLYQDDIQLLGSTEKGSIQMAYFDITNQGLDIDYDFMEAIIAKQPKPSLYVLVDMIQLPPVLMYFKKQDYKFDILALYQGNKTQYVLYLRKGGVKIYGDSHTKIKYFEDDRDFSLVYQDTMHPEFMRRLIVNSSLPGDNIFIYGGYGTAIDVCAKEGRHFIAYAPDEGKFASCSDVIDAIYLREQMEQPEVIVSESEETENIAIIDFEDIEAEISDDVEAVAA